jgi:Putative inner membrane protein (DUF1819)
MTSAVLPRYSIAICKGSALIDETAALLRSWVPGEPLDEFTERVIAQDVLGKATYQRVRDIVRRVFAPRYLRPTDEPARHMKKLLDAFGRDSIRDAALLYSSRNDPLLSDATTLIYWKAARAGQIALVPADLTHFFQEAADDGRIPEAWSEQVATKVARGIVGAWVGFGLIDERHKGIHRILPYSPHDRFIVYLAYVLHGTGLSDHGVLHHPDWGLFGFEPRDLIARLHRLSNAGWWETQVGGDVVRITWAYRSMTEVLDAISR